MLCMLGAQSVALTVNLKTRNKTVEKKNHNLHFPHQPVLWEQRSRQRSPSEVVSHQ